MTTALWTLILMESLFIVAHLINIAYRKPEVRLTAYVLLLWALHRLIFVIISLSLSTELFFISDDVMLNWTIVLMAQFVSVLLGISVCYIVTNKESTP